MDDKENKDKNAEVSNKEDKPSSKRQAASGQLLKRAGTLIGRMRSETKAKMQTSELKKESTPEESKTASALLRRGTLAQVTGRLRALTKAADQLERPVVKKQKANVNIKLWHMLNDALDNPSREAFRAVVAAVEKKLEKGISRGIDELQKQEILEQRMKELVNYSTYEGDTLLEKAAVRSTHPDVLMILVKQMGADINHVSKEGTTPLISAMTVGDHVRACFLVDLGADVNKVGQNGFGEIVSPLIAAVSAAQPDMDLIEAILQKNPDLSFTDQDGRTALNHAEDSRLNEIADRIKAHEVKRKEAAKGKYSITQSEKKEIVDLQKNLEENFTKCKKDLSKEDNKIIDNLIQGVYYLEKKLTEGKEVDSNTPPVAEIKRRLIVANQLLVEILNDQLSSKQSVQTAGTRKVEVVSPEEISTNKGPAVQSVESEPKPKATDMSRKSRAEFSYEDDSNTESMATEEGSEESESITEKPVNQRSEEPPTSAAETPPVSYKSNVYQTSPSGMTQYQEALTKIMSLSSKIGAVKVQEERVNLRDTLKIIGKSFDYQKWIAEKKPVQSKPSDRERVFMAINKLDNLLKKVEKAHKRVEEFKEESPGKKVPRILTTWEKFTKAEVRSQLEKMAKNPIKSSLEGLLEDEKKATMRASNVQKK